MSTTVGIIGAGWMARYHVEGFRRAGAEVIAVADTNLAAAQSAGTQYGIPQVFGDVAQMLATATPDAVAIIVPNAFHAPLSIQCLKAGVHVFCEKPPALNAAQVREMIAAADAADKRLMFNFNNRARPESYAMKAYAEDGTLGTVNSAQAKWLRRTGIPGFGGWFTTKALSGGGPLIDLLHMLDLGLYVMGYPKPAQVLGRTFDTFITDPGFKGPWGIPDVAGGTTDVEAAAHGLITFTSGQVLSLQISWAEMVKREEVSVTFQGTGAGGSISRLFGVDGDDETAIDTCELYVQEHGRSVNRQIVTEPCPDMGRIRSASNFIHAIEGNEAPLNTPDQALALMQIIDAIYLSSQSGKPVAC